MYRLTLNQVRWLKLVLHLLAFFPLIWMIYAASRGDFSADPGKELQHYTGITALKLLIATLLVTPVSRRLKQPLLMRTRRLLGLWCFTWVCLHLLSYYLLELGYNNLVLLGEEIIRRPYLTLGLVSWLILLALSATSLQLMQRKLGRNWQRLHNLTYLVIILAIIHYIWSVKVISPQPFIYAVIILLLLLLRYKKFMGWFRAK